MNKSIPTECPHCGCSSTYTRERVEGSVIVVYDLGKRKIDYSSMYKNLQTTGGKLLYCSNCDKRIGRVEDAIDFYGEEWKSVYR